MEHLHRNKICLESAALIALLALVLTMLLACRHEPESGFAGADSNTATDTGLDPMTGAAVDAIADAKARGLNVTCDTSPPYFALNELAVGEYRTFAKLTPPLRREEDRQAIVAGLADGTIRFDTLDMTPGGTVSGSLNLSLYHL